MPLSCGGGGSKALSSTKVQPGKRQVQRTHLELSEVVVVAGHGALSLVDLDEDGRLWKDGQGSAPMSRKGKDSREHVRLSAAVEKIWDFLVGMTVLRGMSLVKTPPVVSIPARKDHQDVVKGNAKKCQELTEGKRADVDEDDVIETGLSSENTGLDGGSIRDSLVGVDSLRGLLAVEVLLEELLDLRDTGGSSYETTKSKAVSTALPQK